MHLKLLLCNYSHNLIYYTCCHVNTSAGNGVNNIFHFPSFWDNEPLDLEMDFESKESFILFLNSCLYFIQSRDNDNRLCGV